MKSITIRYFDVDYVGLTSSTSLVGRLVSKLSSTAAERMMIINKQSSDKSDLISDFGNVSNGTMITGTCLRIVNSKDAPIITNDMLNQKQFTVSSISYSGTADNKTCLDYFFFCLSDDKLIVTLDQRTGISRFETYLNWLLNTTESGENIEFTPMVDEEHISAAEIKQITINNSFEMNLGGDDPKKDTVGSKIVELTQDVLRKLFSDTNSLDELLSANICSANLTIKFTKPRSMNNDEYKKKTASAILKPLENPDNISFKGKGRKIKGSQVLKTDIIEVDCDDNGAVSEQSVYQQMIKKMT